MCWALLSGGLVHARLCVYGADHCLVFALGSPHSRITRPPSSVALLTPSAVAVLDAALDKEELWLFTLKNDLGHIFISTDAIECNHLTSGLHVCHCSCLLAPLCSVPFPPSKCHGVLHRPTDRWSLTFPDLLCSQSPCYIFSLLRFNNVDCS